MTLTKASSSLYGPRIVAYAQADQKGRWELRCLKCAPTAAGRGRTIVPCFDAGLREALGRPGTNGGYDGRTCADCGAVLLEVA